MNKRIEKIVKNYEAGKITVRRDQLRKAVEEKLYGTTSAEPTLLLPDAIIALVKGEGQVSG